MKQSETSQSNSLSPYQFCLDGEIYLDFGDEEHIQENLQLFDEISTGRGPRYGLMETIDVGYIYESPTLVVGDEVIFGVNAIKAYVKSKYPNLK